MYLVNKLIDEHKILNKYYANTYNFKKKLKITNFMIYLFLFYNLSL